MFNEDLADEVIRDFRAAFSSEMDLMIHCLNGESRSAALGVSLNDIFGLGNNNLYYQYPRFNRYVYNLMINRADELGLV